ncbi:MAG: transposase [Acidobacteriota bacterium]
MRGRSIASERSLLCKPTRRSIFIRVLMSNHIHLVAETPDPTLSAGMQRLLGTSSQWFNKKPGRSRHLFGDRFHSFLIDRTRT